MRRRALLLSLVLLPTVGNFAFGGLIVQPSSGTTIASGVTADFDLIIRNETAGAVWSDIDLIGPLKFEDPIPLLGGQDPPSFVPPSEQGITPDPSWNQFSDNIGGEWVFGTSTPATLNPGEEFTFATLSIFIPADFVGSFQLQLAETVPLLTLLSNGQDVTNGWEGDPNPPLPVTPAPPGGEPPSGFSVTVEVAAIPEPGPMTMLSFLGVMICGLRAWRRR